MLHSKVTQGSLKQIMVSVLSVLILLVAVLSSHAFRPIHSINTISTDFQADRDTQSFLAIQSIRGGGDDYDSEYDEYDEESEDEEIVKLSASAKKAMEKVKTKKKAQAKKTVSASLGKTKSKKIKGPSPFKKIPYIVRALMNPFTVFAMTKGYFASLFNIDYLQEVGVSRLPNPICLFLNDLIMTYPQSFFCSFR